MKAEVEGSEYFDDPAMYDSDENEERRVDMNDGCAYTISEFMDFYGGTIQWENAKPEKKKVPQKDKKKAQQKGSKSQESSKKNQQVDKSTKATTKQKEKEKEKEVAPVPKEINPSEDKKVVEVDTLTPLVDFLTKLQIEEPEYAAEKLNFQKLDIEGVKHATRDDLLEFGLHPRVIDQLQAKLKLAAMESVPLVVDTVVDTADIVDREAGEKSPSGGDFVLSLKDRQWKRPHRPSQAEASSLASGGGLYATTDHNGKDLLSMVVVGHVDAGKSTLMGQLLVSSGVIAPRIANKYQAEAASMGKGSFYLAWVMDEGEDERRHGVTIEVAEKFIETPSKMVKILDAPGHADFVPQMIMGTCQADVGLLVVAASEPEFESGFGGGGQTKEHAMLLKSLGVNQLLVAVNKMDATTPPYSRSRYDFIVSVLGSFLVDECKFKKDKVRFVPVSAFIGENVTKVPGAESPMSLLDLPPYTLQQAIDDFKIPPRLTAAPLRIVVSDILKDSSKALVVSAVVLQGSVDVSQPLLLRPSNDRCVLKALSKEGSPLAFACAGDSVQLTLSDIDPSRIAVGNVLCSFIPIPLMGGEGVETIVPLSRKFTARISTFKALAVPIIKGTQVTLHLGSNIVEANVSKLIALLDSTGAQRKLKPRAISGSCGAVIQIKLEVPLCIETQQTCKGLGRFVVRQRGVTVAAGLITQVH